MEPMGTPTATATVVIDFTGAYLRRVVCPVCPSGLMRGPVGEDGATLRCDVCDQEYEVGFGPAPVLRVVPIAREGAA